MSSIKITASERCRRGLKCLFDEREALVRGRLFGPLECCAWEVWDAIARCYPDESPPMLETIQAFGRKHSGEKLARCVRFTYRRGTFTIEPTEHGDSEREDGGE